MSFGGGGSSGGTQPTVQAAQPYAPAEPALNQIHPNQRIGYLPFSLQILKYY